MTDRPFNTDEPIAYFITWTTYGTWLPGDERGWQRRGQSGIKPPNEMLVQMAKSDIKETAFLLSNDDREIVESVIVKHCEIRGWNLHTVNARSNHVHVVVTASGYHPKTVRDQFKAWSSRNLKPHNAGRERFWTKGASCRWINQEDDLEAAIIYVAEAQDQKRRE
ncbi:MAG: transposase [Fuerstiella sp.]